MATVFVLSCLSDSGGHHPGMAARECEDTEAMVRPSPTVALHRLSLGHCCQAAELVPLSLADPSTVLPSRAQSSRRRRGYLFYKRFYLFLELGEGRQKERERNISVWLPLAHPLPGWGDLARNPGMCPDRELNQRPLSSQASTESTEPHQLG